jgi:hypothetical protein
MQLQKHKPPDNAARCQHSTNGACSCQWVPLDSMCQTRSKHSKASETHTGSTLEHTAAFEIVTQSPPQAASPATVDTAPLTLEASYSGNCIATWQMPAMLGASPLYSPRKPSSRVMRANASNVPL